VFFNLTHNAIDMMSDGKIFLRFEATEKEVVTEVEDTGPGIAPQIADKLFEPFTTHGKSHGTGLGLSICKKTIEDHGGKIWTRTEAGRGAIFCFSLPIVK
jgi:signal transduction histidine kinase